MKNVKVTITSSDHNMALTGVVRALAVPDRNLGPAFSITSTRDSEVLQLGSGMYFFLFHVDVGEGKFELDVQGAKVVGDTGKFDVSAPHDYGLRFLFEVK